MAISTIQGHIADLVIKGEVAIDKMLTHDKRRAIEEKIAGMQGKPLKQIKTALGGDCSYGDIQLVLAHLKYLEQT